MKEVVIPKNGPKLLDRVAHRIACKRGKRVLDLLRSTYDDERTSISGVDRSIEAYLNRLAHYVQSSYEADILRMLYRRHLGAERPRVPCLDDAPPLPLVVLPGYSTQVRT